MECTDESLNGLLDVENLKGCARRKDDASVRLLASGFRVERRLGEDDLDRLARRGSLDSFPVRDDRPDFASRLEFAVSRELRLGLAP